MQFQLPFEHPVIVFGIVLLIILIIPLIFSRLRIPGIVGLIIFGMLIGPTGFGLISNKGGIELLGNVGLLYLMFLAGLELDMQTFLRSSNRSITFGLLTFIVPITIGFFVCRYILNFNQLASLLVASMFSTHTLISYPIVSRFKITKIEPVGITIGGTIITDTLVLFLLVVITALAKGNLTTAFWIQLLAFTLLFLVFILFIFPIIGRWFFRNLSGEPISQYVFVLAMVFVAGILAKIAGIEPIIGAFLAGIIFNRLIPQSSSLMNRIEFIGNALFIPFFLVYVGLLIDLKVFISGWEAIKDAVILITIALITKWIAAYLTQKLYLYKQVYRQLIFGLSSSHAAATIAVILIGYQMQIIDINVLNATIILILVTCLVSSFVTENAARQIIVSENIHQKFEEVKERFLVPISNPDTIDTLIDFASYIISHNSKDPIYTLQVVKKEEDVAQSNFMLNKALERRSSTDIKVEIVSRVDMNVASGIIRACKEVMISDIVLGWSGQFSPKQWLFGTLLENILAETRQPVFVTGLKNPVNSFKQVSILIPSLAEFEPGFAHWLKMAKNFTQQSKAKLILYIPLDGFDNIISAIDSLKLRIKYQVEKIDSWDSFFTTTTDFKTDNLFVFISARRGSISYNSKFENIPKYASRRLKGFSFVIVYPSQQSLVAVDSRTLFSGSTKISVV